MSIDEFAAQWTLDAIPACPAGLCLLMQLAETAPDQYAIAERNHFGDVSDAAVAANPVWQAFDDHYAGCNDCNEV